MDGLRQRRITWRRSLAITIAAVLVIAVLEMAAREALTGCQPHKGMVVAILLGEVRLAL
jgi:hypothetical protein